MIASVTGLSGRASCRPAGRGAAARGAAGVAVVRAARGQDGGQARYRDARHGGATQELASGKTTPVTASPAPVFPWHRRSCWPRNGEACGQAPPQASNEARPAEPRRRGSDRSRARRGAGGVACADRTEPAPGPDSPAPPPPAPAWTGEFSTSGGMSAAHLALLSDPRVIGPSNDRAFGESMRGDVVGPDGDVIGSIYLDFTGWMDGSHGSLKTLWLWVDTSAGQYRYAADATLTSAMLSQDDGSIEVDFSGRYSLTSTPSTVDPDFPHDGTISMRLGFWGDGTLYATSVSMDES